MCTKIWKNKERYVDEGSVFGLSKIKHVTLQKTVAHDFRYDPRNSFCKKNSVPLPHPQPTLTTTYQAACCCKATQNLIRHSSS